MTSVTARPLNVRSALKTVTRLWLLCAAVSLVALGIAAILSAVDPYDVNWVVWLRGSVVAAASVVFVFVTRAAARGSRIAYTRMRWISLLAPIGIAVIIMAPDTGYPVWMKVEQAVVGIIIVIVAVYLNRRVVRLAFARSR